MRITVRATAINSGNGIPASLALGWTHPLPVSVAEQNSTNTAVPVSWGSPQLHLLHLKIRKFHLCNLLPHSTVFSQSIKFVLFTSPSFDRVGFFFLEGITTYGFFFLSSIVGYFWFWPLRLVLRLVSRYSFWSPASFVPVASCIRNDDQV